MFRNKNKTNLFLCVAAMQRNMTVAIESHYAHTVDSVVFVTLLDQPLLIKYFNVCEKNQHL